VSGAAVRFDGQLAVYNPKDADSPCYACVFPPTAEFEETRCATMGIFAPLVGIIGSMQAAEALKLLSRAGQPAVGRLLMLDGRNMGWNDIRLPRNPTCAVCAKLHEGDAPD
jgi:molybdopterin/thiamine biosynthesis adenylyltransferase